MRAIRTGICLALATVATSSAYGDILPPGQKSYDICAMFDADGNDTHIVLSRFVHGSGGPPPAAIPNETFTYEPVATGVCLEGGYRGRFELIAVTKADWAAKAVGTTERSYTFTSKPESVDLETDTGSVDEDSKITKRTFHYAFAGVKDGKLVLYVSKIIETTAAGDTTTEAAKPAGF